LRVIFPKHPKKMLLKAVVSVEKTLPVKRWTSTRRQVI